MNEVTSIIFELNLKYLHDCCFMSFVNVYFAKLSSHPTLSLFFSSDLSDACITKGFTVIALVQVQNKGFISKKTCRPNLPPSQQALCFSDLKITNKVLLQPSHSSRMTGEESQPSSCFPVCSVGLRV